MSIVIWLLVGGIAGWIASIITNDSHDMGIIANIIVGIIGAFIGGTIVQFIQSGVFEFSSAFTGFNLSSILISVVGAVVLLLILKVVNHNT
ncbi:MAG: GlsB/YeaQ/YmgE family stress response membrane protein [bacterium]